jgi:hypothetical protein
MKIMLAMLLLLGAHAARADAPIAPVAPQFFALSSAVAEASARWYQAAFGLKVLDVVRPPGDDGFAMILSSDRLLLEIVVRDPDGNLVQLFGRAK